MNLGTNYIYTNIAYVSIDFQWDMQLLLCQVVNLLVSRNFTRELFGSQSFQSEPVGHALQHFFLPNGCGSERLVRWFPSKLLRHRRPEPWIRGLWNWTCAQIGLLRLGVRVGRTCPLIFWGETRSTELLATINEYIYICIYIYILTNPHICVVYASFLGKVFTRIGQGV